MLSVINYDGAVWLAFKIVMDRLHVFENGYLSNTSQMNWRLKKKTEEKDEKLKKIL